jgi:hypothetical protein
MKKLLFISIFFLVVNFVFAQAVPVDVNVLRQIVDILQKLIQGGQIQVPPVQTPGPAETKVIQPKVIELPRGVMPALPQTVETKPITPEVIRPILPDEDRSDDAIVQINNLRITRILLDPGIENVKAILFAVRDIGWKCMLFESEESKKSLPCVLDVRRPILQKELAIQISNDTILLQKNRQKAKLEDFQVGDKINVYGFMDKDNNAIDALIVRNLNLSRIVKCKPRPACLDQIPPCLIPEPVEGWCPKPVSYIKVLSPNGGEVWQKGTIQLIKWKDDKQFVSPTIKYYDISLVPKQPECKELCPQYSFGTLLIDDKIPIQVGQEMVYKWEVGKIKDKTGWTGWAPDGLYKINICESNTTNCDISDDYFQIVSTSMRNEKIQKKILLLVFNPVLESKPGSPKLNEYFNWNDPYKLTQQLIDDFREVSNGFVNYVISEKIEADGIPLKEDGFQYNYESYVACIEDHNKCHYPDEVNYSLILDKYNVCEKLNKGLIDELWLWGGPWFGFYESRLAGPGAFWYNSPPLLNTSCNRLLPIMGFNYERGMAEALEAYAHRVESVMTKVYGSWEPKETHAWNKFTLLDRDLPGRGGVGNAHNAVNASPGTDYNRSDKRYVYSNADDWYNYPNMTDKRRLLNCEEWSCDDYEYLKWWYKHIPKAEGFTDGILNNWWRYIVDFDNAMSITKNKP